MRAPRLRPPTGLSQLKRSIVMAAAGLLAVAVVPLLAAWSAAAQANLLANPGFEAGTTAGWTCSPLDSVVTAPVHSGTYALAGVASDSDNAQCSQPVSVQPSTSYTLTGYVQGAYVYIGDSGTGSSDTNAWTPSATSWQPLSTTFTPRPVTGTSATITGLAASTATSASGGGGGGGSFAVAPYVDMTNNQEPMLDQAATQAGLKAFTAAFVIGSGCTPIWDDTLPVTNDPTVTGEITQAESEGATPIVSFGGASGVELA